METVTTQAAESEQDFPKDAAGWARRWAMEFSAAKREAKRWHKQGEKIIKRYLDERDAKTQDDTRWNLFPSNVETLEALLYGKAPTVDVTRRFADSQDDLARVSATMLQRLLNGDLERDNDGYSSALEHALQDRLLPGLGNVRLRYVVEMEDVAEVPAQTEPMQDEQGQPMLGDDGAPQTRELAPAVAAHQRKAKEDVATDYIFWKDQLWSPCRVFEQCRWWAFREPMTRDQSRKRFGKTVANQLPLNSKGQTGNTTTDNSSTDAEKDNPWGRTDVWEIYDKESKTVFWYVEGFDKVLDAKKDPLGLEGFWPFPRPMVANATTSKLIPRPDFVLAQDLYDEIDSISTRITRLERSVKVSGLYDKKAGAIQRLLTEAADGELIPVENWAVFDAGGKVEGAIAWLPIDMVVKALDTLRQYRTELINALFQITGMSDIMRGEAAQTATATEQAIKARFGSVRVQRRQDEFARFASDVQRIRAEIICKHFDAETIIERSNILNTPDAPMAQQAVEFLQSDFASYRIQVKPESVSLTDYAALKNERTDVIQTIGGYLQMVQPLAAQFPDGAPELLEILQWLIAGLRGGAQVEGTMERLGQKAKQALEAAKAAQAQQGPPPPPPPDPKIVTAQIKAKGDIQKSAADASARLTEIRAETQSAITKRAADAHFSILEQDAKDRHDAVRAVEQVTGQTPGGAVP